MKIIKLSVIGFILAITTLSGYAVGVKVKYGSGEWQKLDGNCARHSSDCSEPAPAKHVCKTVSCCSHTREVVIVPQTVQETVYVPETVYVERTPFVALGASASVNINTGYGGYGYPYYPPYYRVPTQYGIKQEIHHTQGNYHGHSGYSGYSGHHGGGYGGYHHGGHAPNTNFHQNPGYYNRYR